MTGDILASCLPDGRLIHYVCSILLETVPDLFWGTCAVYFCLVCDMPPPPKDGSPQPYL